MIIVCENKSVCKIPEEIKKKNFFERAIRVVYEQRKQTFHDLAKH